MARVGRGGGDLGRVAGEQRTFTMCWHCSTTFAFVVDSGSFPVRRRAAKASVGGGGAPPPLAAATAAGASAALAGSIDGSTATFAQGFAFFGAAAAAPGVGPEAAALQ